MNVGGILSGPAIIRAVEGGEINVGPWSPYLINPASLDLRLGERYRRYLNSELDAAKDEPDGNRNEVLNHARKIGSAGL